MRFVLLALLGALVACAPSAQVGHPEASLYAPERDAHADLDAALIRAAERNTRVIVVMGANWCHDSRALAGWFETPRFAEMLAPKYEVVYVDVDHPQDDEGRNLEIARQRGIEEVAGTPTVLILAADGELLNADSATSWNDAASRGEDAIFDYFAGFE